MASYIKAVREQNEIEILACQTEKNSPHALNELNLALTQ
jgi:hypothetical protein